MSGDEDEVGLAPVLETVSDADMAVTISLVDADKQLRQQLEHEPSRAQEKGKQLVLSKTPEKKTRASTSKSGSSWSTSTSLGSSKMLWTDWIDSIRKDALTPSKKNNHPHMGLHHLEAIESVLLMWERDLQRREADASVNLKASLSSKGSTAKGRKKSRDEREGSPLKKARMGDGGGWSGSDDERPSSVRTTPGPVTQYSLQWAQQNRSKSSIRSAGVGSSLNSITTLLQTVPRPLHHSLSHVPTDTSSSSSASPPESDTASQAGSVEADGTAEVAGAEAAQKVAESEVQTEVKVKELAAQAERERQRFVFCASDGPSSSAASGEEDNITYDAAGVRRQVTVVPVAVERELDLNPVTTAQAEDPGDVISNPVEEEVVNNSAVAAAQIDYLSHAAADVASHARPDGILEIADPTVLPASHTEQQHISVEEVDPIFVTDDNHSHTASHHLHTDQLEAQFTPVAAYDVIQRAGSAGSTSRRLWDHPAVTDIGRVHGVGPVSDADEDSEEVIHTSYYLADSTQESYDTVVIKEDAHDDGVVNSAALVGPRSRFLDSVEYADQYGAVPGASSDVVDAHMLVDHVTNKEMAAVMGLSHAADSAADFEDEDDDDIVVPGRMRHAVYDEVHSETEDDVVIMSHPEDVDVPAADGLRTDVADSASEPLTSDAMYTFVHSREAAQEREFVLQAELAADVSSVMADKEEVVNNTAHSHVHQQDSDAVNEAVPSRADSAEAFYQDSPMATSITGPSDISTNITQSILAAPSTSYSPSPSHDIPPSDLVHSSHEDVFAAAKQEVTSTLQPPAQKTFESVTRVEKQAEEVVSISASHASHEPEQDASLAKTVVVVATDAEAGEEVGGTITQQGVDRVADMSDTLSLDEERLPLSPTEMPTPSSGPVPQLKHQRVFSVPTPKSGCFPAVPEDFWELPLSQQTVPVSPSGTPAAIRTAPAPVPSHGTARQGYSEAGLWSLPSNVVSLSGTVPEEVKESDAEEFRQEVEQAGERLEQQAEFDFSALRASRDSGPPRDVQADHSSWEQQEQVEIAVQDGMGVDAAGEPDSSTRTAALLSAVAEEEEDVGTSSDGVRTAEQDGGVETASGSNTDAVRSSVHLALSHTSSHAPSTGATPSEQYAAEEEERKTAASHVSAELQYISEHSSPLSSLSLNQHQYLAEPWVQRVAAAQGSTAGSTTSNTAVPQAVSSPVTSPPASPLQPASVGPSETRSGGQMDTHFGGQTDTNFGGQSETRSPSRVPSVDSISGSNPITSPPSSGRVGGRFAGRTIASLPSSIAGSDNWDDLHLGPGASMKLSLSDLTLVIDGEVAEKEQESRKNVLATIHSIQTLHTGASDKGRLSSQDTAQIMKDLGLTTQDLLQSSADGDGATGSRGVNSMVLAAGLNTIDYAQALRDMGLAQDGEDGANMSAAERRGPSAGLLSDDQSDVVDDNQTKLNILEDSLLPLEQNFLPMAPFGLYALKSGNSDLLTGGSGLYALPMSPMAGSNRSERLKSTGAESSDGSQRGRASRRSTWALEGNSPSSVNTATTASHSKASAAAEEEKQEPWAGTFTMVEPEQTKPPPRFTSATRPPSQYRLRSASPSSARTPANVPPRSASAPRPSSGSKLKLDSGKPSTPSQRRSPALTASNLSRIPTSPWSGSSPRKSWDSSVRASSPAARTSQSSLRSSLTSPRASTQQSPSHRRSNSAPQSPSVGGKGRKPVAPRPAWRPVVTPLPPRSLQERKQEMAAAKAAAEASAAAAGKEAAREAGGKVPTPSQTPSAASTASTSSRKLLSVEAGVSYQKREGETNSRLLMSSPGDLMIPGDESQSDAGSGSVTKLMASSPEILMQAGSSSAAREKVNASPAPSSVSSFITASSPRIAASSPRISASSPRISAASPRASTASPRGAAAPRASAASPRVSSPSPPISASSPRISASSPRISASSPRVSSASPRSASSSARLRSPSPRRSLSDIPSLPLKEPLHTGAGFRSTGSHHSAVSNPEPLWSQELETPIFDRKKVTRGAHTPVRSNWSTPSKPPAGKTTANSPSLISTLAAAAGRPQWDLKDQDDTTLSRKGLDKTPTASVRQSYPGASQPTTRKHKLWAFGDDTHQDDWLMSPEEAENTGPLQSVRPESPMNNPALEEDDQALQALRAAEKQMSLVDMDASVPEQKHDVEAGQEYPTPRSARRDLRASLVDMDASVPEQKHDIAAGQEYPTPRPVRRDLRASMVDIDARVPEPQLSIGSSREYPALSTGRGEKRAGLLDMDAHAPERQPGVHSSLQLATPLSARRERRTSLLEEVSRSLPGTSLLAEVSRSLPEFPYISNTPEATPPLTAGSTPIRPVQSPFTKPMTTLPHIHVPRAPAKLPLPDPVLDLSPRWKLRLLPRFRDRQMKTTVEAPAALGGASKPKAEGGRFAARKVKSDGDINPDSPRLRHFHNMLQLQLSLSSLQRVKSGGSFGKRGCTSAGSSVAATPTALNPSNPFRARGDAASTATQPKAGVLPLQSQLFSSSISSVSTSVMHAAYMPSGLPAIIASPSKPSTSSGAKQVLSPTNVLSPNRGAHTGAKQVLSPTGLLSPNRVTSAGAKQVLSPTSGPHSGVLSPAASSAPKVSTILEDQILTGAELGKVDVRSPTLPHKPGLDTTGSSVDFEPMWGFGGASAQQPSESGSGVSPPVGLTPLKTSEWQGMPFDEARVGVTKPTVRQGNYLVLDSEGTDVEEEMWSTGAAAYKTQEEPPKPEKETTFFFRQAQEESLAMQMRQESEALKEKERARLVEEDAVVDEVVPGAEREREHVKRERVSSLPPQPPSARRISVNDTVDAMANMPDAALSSRLLRQRTSGGGSTGAAEDLDAPLEVDQVSAVSAAPPPSTPSFTAPPRPSLASPPASEDISLPPSFPTAVVHPVIPPVNTRAASASASPTAASQPAVELTPAPLSCAHLNALQETIAAQSKNSSNSQDSILQWITDAAYAQDTSSMELAMQLAQLYFPEPPLETIHEESAEYRSSTRSSPTPTPTMKATTSLYTQPPAAEPVRESYRDSRHVGDGPSVKLLPPVGARVAQPPPPPPAVTKPPPATVSQSDVAAALAAISNTSMSFSSPLPARGVAPAAMATSHPRRVSLSTGMAPTPVLDNYTPAVPRMPPPDMRSAGYYQSMPEPTPAWDIDVPISTSKGTENPVMPSSPERTVSPNRMSAGKGEGGSGFGSRLRSRRSGGRSSSKGGSMDQGSSAEKNGKCRVQ